MAQIIELQSFQAARPPRALVAGTGAEILFFLGVRYERMPDPAPEPADRPTRAVRRPRKRRA